MGTTPPNRSLVFSITGRLARTGIAVQLNMAPFLAPVLLIQLNNFFGQTN